MSTSFHIASTQPLLHSYVFDVERRTITDGDVSFERDVVTHRGAVAILAIDESSRVGLIQQFRATVNASMWEIPAGTIDEGEVDPLLVAQRELREELGCVAAQWEVMGRFLNSPGWTNQQMHIFIAHGLSHVDRTPIGPEEERAVIEWWSVGDVRSYLAETEVIDATTTIALQRFLMDYDIEY